jgi:hypothetical protein
MKNPADARALGIAFSLAEKTKRSFFNGRHVRTGDHAGVVLHHLA